MDQPVMNGTPDLNPHIEDIRRFMSWYIRRRTGRIPSSDELQEAYLGACCAVYTHDQSKGAFLPHAIATAKWYVCKLWAKYYKTYEHHHVLVRWQIPAKDIRPDWERTDDGWHVIKSLLESLPDRDRQIMEMRWLKEMTLAECAKILGVSRERIRQIEGRSIRRLRHRANVEFRSFVNAK